MVTIINKINMKYIMKNKIVIAILLALYITSCEKYDDFTNDFDYTTVYFAYQKPVRSLFADNLNMEVGVVLGGRRVNSKVEQVSFKIAPELLTDIDIVGTNTFTLLPENYYTLSDPSTMYIQKGKFTGTVGVKLNESFLSDPLATQKTYALPILITNTSADSILAKKNYTIVLVKYINKHHGVYYHRGVRKKYDASGNFIPGSELSYASNLSQEFIQNIVWNVFTENATMLKTNGVAEFTTGSGGNYSLKLTHAPDDKVGIASGTGSLISNVVDNGGSTFDKVKKNYYLKYEYTDVNNIKNVMVDTLYFRNDELKLELW
jgi:hypothetical protein